MFTTEEELKKYVNTNLHKSLHTFVVAPKKEDHIVITKQNEKNDRAKNLSKKKNAAPAKTDKKEEIYISVEEDETTNGENTQNPDSSYVSNRPNMETGIIQPEPTINIDIPDTKSNTAEEDVVEIKEENALSGQVNKPQPQSQQPQASEPAKKQETKLTLEDIQNSVDVQTLLNQTHALMEITESSLKKISIKQIVLNDISDRTKVKHMLIDNSLLHILGSIIIGKNFDIIFIFRDGHTVSMCPEGWLAVESADNLKQNFNWTYSPFDIKQFISELTNFTAAVTNTPEWTQLWMKYVPIV